jgi:sugar lactone lactonase YvrE
MTGLAIGESPRWRAGRLWLSNWGTQEVVAVDLDGDSEVVARVRTTIPFSIDWLPDGRLLIVSGPERVLLRREPDGSLVTHADLTGLTDRALDGALSNRRVWADLYDGAPDGICIDAENAVWYGDVPNKRCVRVREGGHVLQTVELDRGCFACALGGPDGTMLFMLAAEWRGPANIFDGPPTGQVLTVEAPAPGAGWP